MLGYKGSKTITQGVASECRSNSGLVSDRLDGNADKEAVVKA